MQRYNNIFDTFLHLDLKKVLEDHKDKNIYDLGLAWTSYSEQEKKLLLDQLSIYPKAIHKLPVFTANYCYFTVKSYEQSSSEALARYKAQLIQGYTLLDLSGGLGVDDWAFAQRFEQVVSLDTDEALNEMVKYNFRKLGVKNVTRITADAELYVKECKQRFDVIYIDADRRVSNKKVVTIYESSPDLMAMLDAIFRISDQLLIKLSPLTDLTHITKTLKEVTQIHIVSLNNEVKEILVWVKKGTPEHIVIATDVTDKGQKSYEGVFDNRPVSGFKQTGKYFYEPALCLIKSGLDVKYAEQKGAFALGPGSRYFLSDEWIPDFMGRAFKVVDIVQFSKSAVRGYLKRNSLSQANVAKRNFPQHVEDLKRVFKLKDGGMDYLFFTTNAAKQHLMIHAQKA